MEEEEKIVQIVKKEVMDEAFEKVLKYLRWMKRKIVNIDKQDRAVLVLEDIKGYDEPIKILIKVFNDNWLSMMALIMKNEELRELKSAGCDPLPNLLKLSFRAAEFNFAIDPDDNIIIKQDIHLAALSFDVFEEEYFAIPAAIKAFRDKILPEIKECREITEDKIDEVIGILYT